MNPIFIPATSAEQWAPLLAEPTKHWRSGYSARTLAYSWHEADGFPTEVTDALARPFPDIKLLLAIPEHRVHLPGGSRPSQNDIWVLAKAGSELVSIAVEGKVAEPFGPTLDEWQAEGSKGKTTRLAYLRNLLGLPDALPGPIRYQLLHRTASAVIEAQRFNAAHAVMLVHSFSQSHQWFDDFAAFAGLYGACVAPGQLVEVGRIGGVQLHLGWVRGGKRFLEK